MSQIIFWPSSLQALSFVHSNLVIDKFNELMASLGDETNEILGEFLAYFAATWLGVVQRGRRRRPLFDIKMWNVTERITAGLSRTNKSIEGWHHGLQLRVAVSHPNLCRLVRKLKKEQSEWELTIEQVSAGIFPREQKKHQVANERLFAIVDNYENYEGLGYLRVVAHSLYTLFFVVYSEKVLWWNIKVHLKF